LPKGFLAMAYASMERPDTLDFATSDPPGFPGNDPEGVILDKIRQKTPDFS
jgi:hypothetical protein